jgi:hypothetical protein
LGSCRENIWSVLSSHRTLRVADVYVWCIGAPLNLGQAQENIVSKPSIQPYLTFHTDQPLSSVLRPQTDAYHSAILLHSLYYFPSPRIIADTFSTLSKHEPGIERLYLAEYALQASNVNQQPHVLAVIAEQALEMLKTEGSSSANVQTVLSPKELVVLAKKCGWELEHEKIITPEAALQDGRWEVGTVCSSSWLGEVDKVISSLHEGGRDGTRERAWLVTARDAVLNARDVLVSTRKSEDASWSGKPIDLVHTMDVWCAVFTRA